MNITGPHAAVRSRGQALVEFALLVPVMLLLLLLAIDFGRLFFSYIAVNNAAREGTFYAAAHAGDSTFDKTAYEAAVANAALAETANQSQGGEGIQSVTGPDCFVPGSGAPIDCRAASINLAPGIGNAVTVSVTQPFEFLTPLVGDLFGGNVTLAASATAPVLNPDNVAILPGPSIPPPPTLAPTPTPTPTPTLPPGATPTPTPSPTLSPSPTPVPTCLVPDFKGGFWNNVGGFTALDVWHQQAGFTGTLTNQASTNEIKKQSLQKNKAEPCSASMTVFDK